MKRFYKIEWKQNRTKPFLLHYIFFQIYILSVTLKLTIELYSMLTLKLKLHSHLISIPFTNYIFQLRLPLISSISNVSTSNFQLQGLILELKEDFKLLFYHYFYYC